MMAAVHADFGSRDNRLFDAETTVGRCHVEQADVLVLATRPSKGRASA
jgi:hypothetical protein